MKIVKEVAETVEGATVFSVLDADQAEKRLYKSYCVYYAVW